MTPPSSPPLPPPLYHMTSSASSSSHALDISFNIRSPNSSFSTLPTYIDIENQQAFKKSDQQYKRSLRHTIFVILRGRAMPVKPLLISVIWATVATVITWASRIGYPPHENGECRWWCTPLAVDGNALSYVGFALFLLTSFRVSE